MVPRQIPLWGLNTGVMEAIQCAEAISLGLWIDYAVALQDIAYGWLLTVTTTLSRSSIIIVIVMVVLMTWEQWSTSAEEPEAGVYEEHGYAVRDVYCVAYHALIC